MLVKMHNEINKFLTSNYYNTISISEPIKNSNIDSLDLMLLLIILSENIPQFDPIKLDDIDLTKASITDIYKAQVWNT